MFEQLELAEKFTALLKEEQQALRLYSDLAAQPGPPRMREQILRLLREKQRHVELAQRLVEMVE